MRERAHPTQKPVGLYRQILEDIGKDFNLILDRPAGSGSALIACEKLGRTCYAMELSPDYVDVCVARWEQLTGQVATR